MGFLDNLVKVFPSLSTRPLYLTGESYAGTYIVCQLQIDFPLLPSIPSAIYLEDLLWNAKPPCQHRENSHWRWGYRNYPGV